MQIVTQTMLKPYQNYAIILDLKLRSSNDATMIKYPRYYWRDISYKYIILLIVCTYQICSIIDVFDSLFYIFFFIYNKITIRKQSTPKYIQIILRQKR